MILIVTEKCLVERYDKGNSSYCLRHYKYETSAKDFKSAIIDLEDNFDSDNIIANSSNDDFDGECLDSKIMKVEILEED